MTAAINASGPKRSDARKSFRITTRAKMTGVAISAQSIVQ